MILFFYLKIYGYILNVELIKFSEKLNPGYERKRNMKDDSKHQELGSSASVFSDLEGERIARWPAPDLVTSI